MVSAAFELRFERKELALALTAFAMVWGAPHLTTITMVVNAWFR